MKTSKMKDSNDLHHIITESMKKSTKMPNRKLFNNKESFGRMLRYKEYENGI